MPKQNQSETLSLPQLLQLAGIGGQPQQDTTREALGYMMGQQRLQADDADRKVKMQQAEQENAYRMKALEQQANMQTQSAANAELALAADLLYRNVPGSEGHSYGQSILARRLGPKPVAVPEKTYENDPKLQPGYKAPSTGGPMTADKAGQATAQAVGNVLGAVAKAPIAALDFVGGYAGVPTADESMAANQNYWTAVQQMYPVGSPQYNAQRTPEQLNLEHVLRQRALREAAGLQPKY